MTDERLQRRILTVLSEFQHDLRNAASGAAFTSSSSSSSSRVGAAPATPTNADKDFREHQEEATRCERLAERQVGNHLEYGTKAVIEHFVASLSRTRGDERERDDETRLQAETSAIVKRLEDAQLGDRNKLQELIHRKKGLKAGEVEELKQKAEQLARDLSRGSPPAPQPTSDVDELNFHDRVRGELHAQIQHEEKLLHQLQQEVLTLSSEESALERTLATVENKRDELKALLIERKGLLEQKDELEKEQKRHEQYTRHVEMDVRRLDATGITVDLRGVLLHVPWKDGGTNAGGAVGGGGGQGDEDAKADQNGLIQGGGDRNSNSKEKKLGEFDTSAARIVSHPEVNIRDLIRGEDLAGLCERARYKFFLQKEATQMGLNW
mmetsp:Transcript_27508/g.69369  ORF Transcript_27508/g.69369 Transcript_27508/m.69369 type:complete len:381 (+) Transcript_27508:214-1356(+)|eukprot:CAMPEP_0179007560 /NCGR_PEP_ID=MMETSP0795-20121207/15227_1 /TAXON_ID=88552 /ORGANISM="Amoebophrya sp., Strain Ameob2" /LENGTH=380 /DNA_ID=CAMNT_0020702545 /DNA_START=150 /DNA_END=1292 /DNA_ORIENTATION=-